MNLAAWESHPCRGLEQEPSSWEHLRTHSYPEQVRAPEPECDYLVAAAVQLRLALERDVGEDYEAAFNHYQNGVDVLLRGVQVDPNRERCEAVKLKIAKYLRRAEEIFNCHLQKTLGGRAGQGEGFSSLRLRPIRTMSSALEQLRNYHVVGIIGKVQLVQDPDSGGTFVSLPRSPEASRERLTIIPRGVPYMTRLLRYFVSEDSIFLHLEHVQGGPLWSCLSHPRRPPPGLRRCLEEIKAPKHSPRPPPQPSLAPRNPPRAPGKSWVLPWVREGASRVLGGRAPAEEQVRLWAAQALLALGALHEQGLLCRDLNPRNLLLDQAGHLRLTYFGQWAEVEPQCCREAVDGLYSAPEVGGIAELTEACDWWSFGSLLYELLTGTMYPCPQALAQSHPSGIQPHTQLQLPDWLSQPAASLLTELLQFDPARRLGSVESLRSHPFFSSIQWSELLG